MKIEEICLKEKKFVWRSMFRAVAPAKGEVKMMTWGQGNINPEQQLAGEPTHDL